MPASRLLLASSVMAAIALALRLLAPAPAELLDTLGHAQRASATLGPDAVVLALAGLSAWLVWGWGTVGLTLTAMTAAPGALGAAARQVLRVVLPAAMRPAAAMALGIGLAGGLAGGLGVTPALAASGDPASAAAITTTTDAAADRSGLPPDWPRATGGRDHLVVPGDCLWWIAADRLTAASGGSPSDREVAGSVQAWWTANAGVIGPDPDLILPGQVLHPPDP